MSSLNTTNGEEAITGLKRVSKPGLRVSQETRRSSKSLNGLGIAGPSTSEGLLTDKEARQKNVGGEVIAYGEINTKSHGQCENRKSDKEC